MFWMFILVSVSRVMTWSMWVMSQASRSLLPAGTSPGASETPAVSPPRWAARRPLRNAAPALFPAGYQAALACTASTGWPPCEDHTPPDTDTPRGRTLLSARQPLTSYLQETHKSQKLQGTFDSDFSMQTKENLARGMSWLSVQIHMKLEHFRDRPTVHIIVCLLN